VGGWWLVSGFHRCDSLHGLDLPKEEREQRKIWNREAVGKLPITMWCRVHQMTLSTLHHSIQPE
jgi:hypothetical protein